jgi:hypothetical protein
MRIFLLLALLSVSVCTLGQIQKKLRGSWKVIAISGDELSYDFKKDSAVFNAGQGIDSIRANALAAELFAHMGTAFFVFTRAGKLIQKFPGVPDDTRDYMIDVKSATITTIAIRTGIEVKERIRYQFKGKDLILTLNENDGPLHLTLERQD